MDRPRKRTIAAGALPLVVAASLAGVPAAGADDETAPGAAEEIIIGPPEQLPGLGAGPPGLPLETALLKVGELGFPGNTEQTVTRRVPGAIKVGNITLKRGTP